MVNNKGIAYKKGEVLERIGRDFLERIFREVGYSVVGSRKNGAGTQNGFDVLIEIVDNEGKQYNIFCECKNYKSKLNYLQAIEKMPQLISTHPNIDLLLFLSPHEDFSNDSEDSKLREFYEIIGSRCPVLFLTPQRKVRDYFSLYPDLFEQVYDLKAEPFPQEERQYILRRFEKLLFSDRHLKRVVVGEGKREEYIGDFYMDTAYIPRTYRKEQVEDPYRRNEPDQKLLVRDLLSIPQGVVLLGNPGYGKTMELKQLAVYLWGQRDVLKMVPIFRSLKDFHSGATVEGLLPDNYMHIHQLVLIFDGIDEVHDITDFSNKLRSFMVHRKEQLERGAIKIVISCRTNIYLRYIKKIGELVPIFVNGVTDLAAIQFLATKFGVDISGQDELYWRHRDIFQNPFYLNLIGEGFRAKGELLFSRAKLMEEYIKIRLEEDVENKYRNDHRLDGGELLKDSKKLAIAMEAMQRTELKTSEMSELVGQSRDFAKNPFLEQHISGAWSFEHKNIQEFLTAKLLSTLPFEEVLRLIRVDENTDKVHPSWYNDVAFLLNLDFDRDCYGQLVAWLSVNDPELIFGADPESVGEGLKESVLQTLFGRTCIEQTLWLDDPATVGRFGDTAGNVTYLIAKAGDQALGYRARITAFSLLAEMTVSDGHLPMLAEVLERLMVQFKMASDQYLALMEGALDVCLGKEISERMDLLPRVIVELREFDYRQIVHSILQAIPPSRTGDYLEYIFEVLGKEVKDKSWKYNSNYGTSISTAQLVFDVFCRVEDPGVLVVIYRHLAGNYPGYDLEEEKLDKYFRHMEKVFRTATAELRRELVAAMADTVLQGKADYLLQEMMVPLVRSCKVEKELFMAILQGLPSDAGPQHFLVKIAREDFFAEIAKCYNSGNIGDGFLLAFRNAFSYEQLGLVVGFEREIARATVYRFEHPTHEVQVKERWKFFRGRDQLDFNLRFDVSGIVSHMERIYADFGVRELGAEDFKGFSARYYRNEMLQLEVLPYAKRVLGELLRRDGQQGKTLSLEELGEAMASHELERWGAIRSHLPSPQNKGIVVSVQQRKQVLQWCRDHAAIVLETLSEPDDKDDKDWKIVRLMYDFQKYFKFEGLPEDLLFGMVWMGRSHNGLDLSYMEGVVPQPEIDAHIMGFLEREGLLPESRYQLLRYAIERKLSPELLETYAMELVREDLSKGRNYYSSSMMHLLLGKKVDFLKELVVEFGLLVTEKTFLPSALDRLIKLGEIGFVNDFVLSNETGLVGKGILEEMDIIAILLRNNHPSAFSRLGRGISENVGEYRKVANIYRSPWQGYTNPAAIDDLLDMVGVFLEIKAAGRVFGERYSPLAVVTDTLIGIAGANGEACCLDILEKIESRGLMRDMLDDDVRFYLYSTVKGLEQKIVAFRSKPYTFSRALKMIDENRYLFV